MSHGDEPYGRDEHPASRPNFEVALRGYDKRQVEQYVTQVAGDIANLTAERDRTYAQLQNYAAQHQEMHAELTELRQRPPQLDRASFRDLGPMVEQIIALAEKQAEAIVTGAEERANERETLAERTLSEAREAADRTRAERRSAREEAEREAHRINEQSAAQLSRTQAETAQLVEQARNQVQQEIEAARTKSQQELAQWQ